MSETTEPAKATAAIYSEFLKHSGDKSSVWHYYLRDEKGLTAKCMEKKCQKILKTSAGSTTGLRFHLKRFHDVDLSKKASKPEAEGEEEAPQPKKVKVPIPSFFLSKKKTMAECLAKLTSKDGLPFSVFITSVELRAALTAYGLENIPKSANGIRDTVINYSKDVRARQKSEILSLKKSGQKFCLTFDEWTSNRNRRYMNIIVQTNHSKLWNLGLVRMRGSMTAENCLQLVQTKINDYGLSLEEDIICIVTDGSSVMTKIGKIAPTIQQLCYAHGLQLAVVDVLYKKRNTVVELDVDPISDQSNTEDSDNESSETAEFAVERSVECTEISHEQIYLLIQKVRNVVHLFRKSPLKNETLQLYVKQAHGVELQLLMDSKTRWSSLLTMIERFYKLKSCIKKALVDVSPDTSIEEWEFERISDLMAALQPLKAAVEALCQRDANLITADATLKFTQDKLSDQNTPISLELLESVQTRIQQRRTVYSGLLSYLHNRKYTTEDEDEFFPTPNRKEISTLVKDMIERLDRTSAEEVVESESESSEPHQHKKKHEKSDLQMELNNAIKNALSETDFDKLKTSTKPLVNTIKTEMKLFEDGGKRGYNLDRAYGFLLGISPTSVESERAFSSSGYLCNKIRCRLNDDTLDELCFLRSYFRKIDQV